jgi:hypothetical protein
MLPSPGSFSAKIAKTCACPCKIHDQCVSHNDDGHNRRNGGNDTVDHPDGLSGKAGDARDYFIPGSRQRDIGRLRFNLPLPHSHFSPRQSRGLDKTVNRSKRIENREPPKGGIYSNILNWSNLLSASSWLRTYSRIVSSSRPIVETQ